MRLEIATLCARDGQTRCADSLIAVLKAEQQSADSTWPEAYWTGLGWYEIARGDYAAAVKHFDQAVNVSKTFEPQLGLARAYDLAGHLGDAVTAYEDAGKSYDWSRLRVGPVAVLYHYWLAMAYERSGWNDKAIGEFENFLGIWKNADPGISEIADAKARLKKLRNFTS